MANPFDTWADTAEFNKSALLNPREYISCWHTALARMAILLNQAQNQKLFPATMLAWDDDQIIDYFRETKAARECYVITLDQIAPDLSQEAIADEDVATNFFYGSFDFRTEPRKTRIVYRLTDSFLDYSYKYMHPPRQLTGEVYKESEVNQEGLNPSELMRKCATNYLLRNFWHNFVHVKCQHITSFNFHEFRGEARNQSDFEADNLSYIILAKSYGHTITANRVDSYKPDNGIIKLIRRNRCNEMFRARAKARGEKPSLEDQEWRTRRSIASYISGWLLAQGLAVARLDLHLTGPIVSKKRGWERKNTGFAIALNGSWIGVGMALPEPDAMPDDRREFLLDVARNVQTEYRKRLQGDPRLQRYASEVMNRTLERLGLRRD